MLYPDAYQHSLLDFSFPQGHGLGERTEALGDWLRVRRAEGVWPFSRVACSQPADSAVVANEFGENPVEYINFGSQDYLSLGQHPQVCEAAKAAIDEVGIHSAGSPIVTGRTHRLLELEERLARILRCGAAIVYPTGWAAGFGVLQGLVRFYDTVLIDSLAHSCLVHGAQHASRRVRQFRHNDLNDLERLLQEERSRTTDPAIFVVTESLYSMDSDSPDLRALNALTHRYDAVLIIDVAHDFGCMGDDGLGLLASIDLPDERLVIMGSFSKTFASNGGFVASTSAVRDHLAAFSAPFTFSNAISPLQTAVVLKSVEIAFSGEGIQRRRKLLENCSLLRTAMTDAGLNVGGSTSPIVPVFVGDEATARATARAIMSEGLLANLAEFPGVPRGKARFRFQVMSSHKPDAIARAAEIMASGRERAMGLLREVGGLAPGTENESAASALSLADA